MTVAEQGACCLTFQNAVNSFIICLTPPRLMREGALVTPSPQYPEESHTGHAGVLHCALVDAAHEQLPVLIAGLLVHH